MDNSTTHDHDDQDDVRTPDNDADKRDNGKDDGHPAPFAPDGDDDSPLGDTDQHSDA